MIELKVKDLSVSYGELPVLKGFSYDFTPAGCYALMGESGVGKTTLLHTLAGLIKPRNGDIGGFRAVKCAVLFQEDRLLNHLTAMENVALVSDEKTAEKWLCALGLSEKLHEHPTELSGGQRRRVALARCLAFGGDVLLLDEPFTGLDEETRANACRLISENFPHVILSTHDREEARLLGATIVEM